MFLFTLIYLTKIHLLSLTDRAQSGLPRFRGAHELLPYLRRRARRAAVRPPLRQRHQGLPGAPRQTPRIILEVIGRLAHVSDRQAGRDHEPLRPVLAFSLLDFRRHHESAERRIPGFAGSVCNLWHP